MNIPGLVFLIIFGVVSLIHLFFCYKENELYRRITKTFCVLFLGVAAVCFMPTQPIVYIATFLGVVGDFFLIWKKNKLFFSIGTAAFIGGHVLYLIKMISLLSYQIPWYGYLIFALILACGAIFGIKVFTVEKPPMAAVGGMYMSLLLCCLACGIMVAVDTNTKPITGIFLACGYLLFFISD